MRLEEQTAELEQVSSERREQQEKLREEQGKRLREQQKLADLKKEILEAENKLSGLAKICTRVDCSVQFLSGKLNHYRAFYC